MKKITRICLILTILIIVSTLTNINAVQINKDIKPLNWSQPIEVSKKVWNGEDWVDSTTKYFGEEVLFNLTITYNKNCEEGLWATQIQAIDTLPSFIKYNRSLNYDHTYIEFNTIYWNLSDIHGVFLEDSESISILYEARIFDYGIDINLAEVTAWEAGCDNDLYGSDSAEIIIADPLIVKKEVYDPVIDKWVDEYFGSVTKVEPIVFRINITYTGYYDVNIMKCMIVEDFLSDSCFEYIGNEVYTYPNPDVFHDPEIIVSEDLTHIIYDWTNRKFNLFSGNSLYIQFEAKVVEYSYSVVENCAYVDLWSSLQYPEGIILEDSDCAKVHCFPPDSFIEKKVKDPDSGEWVEEISVYVSDSVTYKINLTYYGNYNYHDISVLDKLHCTMDFIEGSATPPASDISGKLMWWNFTGPLNDSETIEIEFRTEAVSGTGCGAGANTVIVTAYEKNKPFEFSNHAYVKVISNFPPFPPDITGDTDGFEGDELTFRAVTLDNDGDSVYYMFDWDDGTYSDWLGPFNQGQEAQAKKIWDSAGTYNVRAKAKDSSLEEESDWSFYPVEVKIEVPPVPFIDIVFKPGFGLTVCADIKNTGEVNFFYVNWNLTIQRTGLIQKIYWQSDGEIYYFPIGKTVNIKGKPSGLGSIKVTLIVEAPGMDPIEFTVDGLIFSRLVYIR